MPFVETFILPYAYRDEKVTNRQHKMKATVLSQRKSAENHEEFIRNRQGSVVLFPLQKSSQTYSFFTKFKCPKWNK